MIQQNTAFCPNLPSHEVATFQSTLPTFSNGSWYIVLDTVYSLLREGEFSVVYIPPTQSQLMQLLGEVNFYYYHHYV